MKKPPAKKTAKLKRKKSQTPSRATKLVQRDRIMGCMAGEVEIVGDIESPIVPESDWEVLRDPDRVLNPR